MVVHLVWSPDAGGIIEIWLGQQKVLYQPGNVGVDHHGEGVYWKFGLYRTEVDNSVDAVYLDELRRGLSRTSVAPVDKDCKRDFATIIPVILPLLLSK